MTTREVSSKKFGIKKILVDEEDSHLLKNYTWSLPKRNDLFYAVSRGPAPGKLVYLHRIIVNAGKKVIDHINGDGLDNRKVNLRICHQKENARNKRKTIGYSKYKGVYWHKRRNHWCAEIKVNYKKKYLGSFSSEQSAASAYNEAALTYFGEFAKLNEISREDSKS